MFERDFRTPSKTLFWYSVDAAGGPERGATLTPSPRKSDGVTLILVVFELDVPVSPVAERLVL